MFAECDSAVIDHTVNFVPKCLGIVSILCFYFIFICTFFYIPVSLFILLSIFIVNNVLLQQPNFPTGHQLRFILPPFSTLYLSLCHCLSNKKERYENSMNFCYICCFYFLHHGRSLGPCARAVFNTLPASKKQTKGKK